MRYDELYTRHRALCERYIPSLASKHEAYAALRSLNNDPNVSQNERDALTEYVADYIPVLGGTILRYTYCSDCGFMTGFTNHAHCDSCQLPCTHLLSCGICEECCADNCLICESCGDHFSAILDGHRFHDDCNRCDLCCACDSEDEDNEDESFQHTPSYGKSLLAVSKKDRITFNCARLAGVEWEYNYVDSIKALESWKQRWGGAIHYDGSCGEEAVTSPMAGDYIAKVITELGAAFKTGRAKIDNKCSVHVHVDAHDYSWHDMFKLLKVYSKLEPLLYLLAGQQRLESIYCVPIGKDFSKIITTTTTTTTTTCPDPKGAVMALALKAATSKDARNLQRNKPGKRTEGRRRGLNISPWLAARKNKSPDATVEFRMHRDTYDAARVIGWTKLCVRLVDWCVKSSDKDIENLPNSPLRSLCQMIAPDCSGWILSRIKEWRESTKFAGKYKRRIHVRGGKYEY